MNNHKANILMVDDQPAKLLSYEAILGELGENLIKATSGREALEQLLKNDVAVVLMDVSMPEIDGFEMAEMIRQHPRFHKTAIIFISAVHLTDLDRIKGYQRGAVDYISVPVVPELLRAKVSVFAELYRKTRELESLNQELEQRVEERTEELRERENQFRTLANSIPQLAWMAEADGNVSWYNQRWYDYTGTTLEEVQGWGWKRVHHPDHVERVVQGIQRAWDTGEVWEDTFPIIGKDGQYRWFLSRAVPIHDSHGHLVRWFGTNTDVSQQIEAKERIRNLNRELEQRVTELETIMQVLPVGVAVANDASCKSVTANAALVELLGGRATEKTSGSPRDDEPLCQYFRDGQPLSEGELPLHRAVATGQPLASMELEVRRRDGNTRHLLASARPLFADAGEVRGAVAAYYDVTDRKHMEDMLRQRADLLELASEAIMVRDRNGILLFWNSGAEALYGWKREEALGKNVHELLRTKFPFSRAEIDSALEQHGRWDGNLTHHSKDGRELIVASRHALDAEHGVVLEITRDITAQLQAEEALRNTEKLAAMGRVAGIIAHEINNPLEAITNAFYLLRDHPSLDEDARYLARLGEEELLRVSHITRQTLSFYRESAQPMLVSVPDLLENVLDLQARRLQLNGIALERQYRTRGITQAFPGELKQVFLNLIGNAIQAMPQGGRLRLRVSESPEPGTGLSRVCISVCDSGGGIKAEHSKRVFEPFFSTKGGKGTGLGLWISKGIVQKHEGTISCRSFFGSMGTATCFKVVIPAVAASVETLPEPVSSHAAVPGPASGTRSRRHGAA